MQTTHPLAPVPDVAPFVHDRPGDAAGASSLRHVDDVVDLCAVYEDAVNVVVLRRTLGAELTSEAASALRRGPLRVLTTVTPGARGRADIEASLEGFPVLASDVHFWVEVVAELTGCALVGVRLARVVTPMCPRLHVDKVPLRVVTTYAGAGTEYVAGEEIDRRWLAREGTADALLEAARPRRARVGEVVVLKGETWPNNAGRGAVHRSPAASERAPRLVMTLDPLG